jgi:3-hydroxyisobutyrate dehydrogenase-like beta-hydroxyacid dehydrogenase
MTRVALLGTGRMGGAIATRLAAAGHEVVLWNRTRARATALGVGVVAGTPAAAAAAADVVLTSLLDPDALRRVVRAALDGARGQTFVDTSTVGVRVLEELAPELRARGSDLLDCPIAGTPTAVEQGDALLLLSGDRGRAQDAEPVLAAIGHVRYVGALGTASRLKLASNCIVAATNLAAAELVAAGRGAGLELEALLDLLERQAPGLRVRRGHFLDPGGAPPLFTVAGMVKDLDLALETFADAALPLAELARDAFTRAAAEDPGADLSQVVR